MNAIQWKLVLMHKPQGVAEFMQNHTLDLRIGRFGLSHPKFIVGSALSTLRHVVPSTDQDPGRENEMRMWVSFVLRQKSKKRFALPASVHCLAAFSIRSWRLGFPSRNEMVIG